MPSSSMNQPLIASSDPASLGRSLKTWRALRRLKQHHAGELLGVTQTTISRWESGQLMPGRAEQAAIRRLMQARLDSAADHELARLVTQSPRPVHLVCDLTHKLLALSAARGRDCRVPSADLVGRSLWRYASAEIMALEAELPRLGWFEPAPPAIEGRTGATSSAELPIRAGRFRWVRFQLSDGTFVRLVETLAPTSGAAGRMVGAAAA